MDRVLQAARDMERKCSKMNAISSKGASKMTVNDMIKQTRKGIAMKSCIKKGIKACRDANPSSAQMQELVNILKHIIELEEKQMMFAIESKPYFDKMHCSGIVKKSIEKAETTPSALEFGVILAKKHFPALRSEVDDMKRRELAVVRKTIAAYSNAIGGEDQVDGLEDKAGDSD